MTERASTETIFGPSKRALTVSVMATIAIVAYNNLGVSAALPEIGNDLGDVALLPWTISAELLTAGVALDRAEKLHAKAANEARAHTMRTEQREMDDRAGATGGRR